eukprot:4599126-Prymnesium_polylepis.1
MLGAGRGRGSTTETLSEPPCSCREDWGVRHRAAGHCDPFHCNGMHPEGSHARRVISFARGGCRTCPLFAAWQVCAARCAPSCRCALARCAASRRGRRSACRVSRDCRVTRRVSGGLVRSATRDQNRKIEHPFVTYTYLHAGYSEPSKTRQNKGYLAGTSRPDAPRTEAFPRPRKYRRARAEPAPCRRAVS